MGSPALTAEAERIIAAYFGLEALLGKSEYYWMQRARLWALCPNLTPVHQLEEET